MEKDSGLYKFLKTLWVLLLSLWYAIKEALTNKLNVHASSSTYYFLVSMIPILIFAGMGAVSIAKGSEILSMLDSIPLYVEVRQFIDSLGINIPRVSLTLSFAGIISVFYALWSASALMRGIARTFSTIFSSKSHRKNIAITFTAYFFIPLLLIASIIFVSMSNAAAGIADWLLVDMLKLLDPGDLSKFAPLLTYLLIFMTVYLSFMLLAPERPKFFPAFIGATLFMVYYFALQNIITGMMASLVSKYAIYGALGTLLLILLWAYLVFYGLFITAQYTAVIDDFSEYMKSDYQYIMIRKNPNIIEKLVMQKMPFAGDIYLRDMSKGAELELEKISLVRVAEGLVLVNGGDRALKEGEYQFMSADTLKIRADEPSRLLIVSNEEFAGIIKNHPEIWDEINL